MQFKFQKPNLKIIPLGGLQEIGKNITVFEYEDEIILVDCGLEFPGNDMLGVDLVIPDITYINKKSMAQDIGNTLENYTTVDIQDLVSCEILGSTEDSKILSVNIYASNKDEGDTISSAVKKAISDYGEIKGLSMPNLMDEVCYGGMFTGVYDTQAANESRTSALVTKRDSYVPKKN